MQSRIARNFARSLSAVCAVLTLLVLASPLTQAQITPLGDAYTNTASSTTNFGSKTTLDVDGATEVTYIQFPLSSIPSGARVSQATLKLFVNSVQSAGSFNVYYVGGPWSESALTSELAPALGNAIASNVSVNAEDKNQYILINVTPALEAWLNGSEPNNGLALVANGAFSAGFDSKENTATGHSPELDVVLATAGNLQWNGADLVCVQSPAAQGEIKGAIKGEGATGSTSANIVTCGGGGGGGGGGGSAITGVTAGTDLTGGGTSGNVTLNVNTSALNASYAQLAAANTFTGNQTVSGNLSATGVVTGTGFQIGSNLFDYGSYANQNAFTGFAGNTTMTGTGNTAGGVWAFLSNTTGEYNTAFGAAALNANTVGNGNTAIGIAALWTNTSGTSNVAVGESALTVNSTGGGNTAIGTFALTLNSTGFNSTAVGDAALAANTTGGPNSAFGAGALWANTTGGPNEAFGFEALFNNNGNNSSAFGYEALYSNTTGLGNQAFGYQALYSNTSANYNAAFGGDALVSNTIGQSNTAVGGSALYDNTEGSENTAVGHGACGTNTTSSDVTCLGYNANVVGGVSNATAIGAHARVEQSNSLVLGATGINVGIGTTKPSNILTVGRGAGHPVSDSWETYSSRRWKTNIHTLPDALSKVEQLRGVSYDLKDSGKHEIGVIAEEVGAVVPEVVSYEKNGKDAAGVDYSRLTALLIEAVKQQQRQIKTQQQQVSEQQRQISAQRKEVAALRTQLRKRAAKDVVLESRLAELEQRQSERTQLASVRSAH